MDSQNKLLATIQIESRKQGQNATHDSSYMHLASRLGDKKSSVEKNLKSGIGKLMLGKQPSTLNASDNSKAKSKQNEPGSVGFPMIDQHTIHLLSNILSLKLDQLQAQKQESDMQQEVIQTIELAGTICTQRSQPELVRLLRKHLPPFFGFQGVGVLLKDQKSELMFTLNELTDECDEKGHDHNLHAKDHIHEHETKKPDADSAETDKKKYNELRKMEKITVPSALGMSGASQETGQILYTNNPDAEQKFQKDVDNQTEIGNVRNLMVGPVFGHKNDHLRELHPEILNEAELKERKRKGMMASDLNKPDKYFKEINHNHPIGMIQLVNKKDYRQINEYDKRKFEAI